MMPSLDDLKVKIFADGADLQSMLELARRPWIRGFTTNPSLMRKAGVADYETFARQVLAAIPDRPISFEVFADDFPGMRRQAERITAWGSNVYVKIPVTNTRGEPALELMHRLAHSGIRVNATALFTLDQVRQTAQALAGGAPCCISVFAGRIADTGRDPLPVMAGAVALLRPHPELELIWASTRETWNLFQADSVGCHIITVTHDLLGKLPLLGKDLTEYSLATVRAFYEDARQSGYRLD